MMTTRQIYYESYREMTTRQIYYESYRDRRVSHKVDHYFEIYDRFFQKFLGHPITLLEIGLGAGGSLNMWRDVFPQANIFGIDIDQRCAAYGGDRTKVFIGSQGDEAFLKSVGEEIGPIDIIIDDGSHQHPHQILTATTLFPYLRSGGILLVEDMHTSYDQRKQSHGGGRDNPNTGINFFKRLVDEINHASHRIGEENAWTKGLVSLSFLFCVCILEKGEQPQFRDVHNDGRHKNKILL